MGCICFFNTAIAWGGGEKWHLDTSTYLHQKGYDVIVVAHPKSVLLERLDSTDIPTISVTLTNRSFLNPFKRFTLKKELAKHNIDTIIMNLSRDVKIAGACAKSIGVKRIIYRRGSAIPIKNTFLNRYYFKKILTEILANSQATKKTILENNPNLFPNHKITVLYNGIDLSKFSKVPKNNPRTDKKLTLINLGRLEAQKNQAFLIDLAEELRQRNLPVQIGIGGEGRLKKVLQQRILEANLEDRVKLEGFIDKPLEFISKGDIFVLSSLWEGFGYVLAEAAACKKPIIAFNTSSNPELVIDEKTGFLVAINNIKEFADAVERLYHDLKRIKEMGENGQRHVKENFDEQKNLQKIEAYLVHG